MSLNASTAGLRVLHHVLGMSVQDAAHAMSAAAPFLTYDEDKKTLDFIRQHLSKHNALPTPDTILDQIAVFLPKPTEPYDFDFDQLRGRFLEDGMRAASDKASAFLQENKPEEALSAMLSGILPLTNNHHGLQLFDFRETEQSALALYQAQLTGTAPPVDKLGIPSLDKQGGVEPGDMIGIVGRPQAGKTWLMLNTALNFWAKGTEPVLFVTQEMSSKQIERRALPLVAGVDPTPMYMGQTIQYELNGETPESYMKKLKEAAAMLKGAEYPFLFYDSKMAGTVADIESIAAIHGVKKIFVDGAYMLRHPDPRLGRYARVPENLDLMKQFTQRTGASLITSWQFKRNAGKQDAAGDVPDLDDIGYSHAIGEYMGVILGLLENPKNLGQVTKKHVTIMKGRNGETGGFDIHWDFKKMNFEEISKAEMETELTYL